MRGIPIYPPGATDYSTNGLGLLLPSECIIKNGTHLTMTQPIEDDLRWAQVQPGCVVKAATPMRESPLYEMSAPQSGTSITRSIYRVKTNGSRLHLRQKPSTTATILGKYPVGTEVIKLEESGKWYRVSILEGGAAGWMYADYLVFDRDVTETITSAKPGAQSPIKVQPSRDQLYRIYSIETDTETGLQRAHALPLAYDLAKNPVGKEYSPENVPAAQAAREIFDAAQNPHDFTLHIGDIQGNITGEYGYKGIIECLMEPETGIAAQSGCVVIFDNLDIFLIPAAERDMGVTIRRGKNLIGLTVTTDASEVYTRVIPRGRDADGNNLYLSGIPYVDSPRIGSYPVIRSKVIDYDVEVSDDEDALFPTTEAARAELGRLAESEFSQNAIDSPAYGMTVDFVSLADVAEYAQYAHLQSVHLYDTVTVIDELIGLVSKVRATGYTWDVLAEQYTELIFGELNSLRQMTYGYSLAAGTVSGNKLMPGSIDGDIALRNWTVGYAKIAQAAIKQLNAEAVTAARAHIHELVAGNITTDQLYADLAIIAAAQITAANIDKANINWAEIASLNAQIAAIAKAQITTATIKEANITWAEIDALNAQIASIAQAKIENIEVDAANIKNLEATVAKIFSTEIGSADIGFAQIKDLVTKQAIITEGVGGQLYIARLAVTEANMVSLSVGELMIKGDDGRFYALGVDENGNVTTTVKLVVNDDVADNAIHGTDKLIEGSITAQVLNVQNIFGDSAIIRQMIADNLDVARLFAREATIAQLNAVDIRGNEYLQLTVNSKSTVYRSEVPPSEASASDLWIRPSSGITYQLADDSEELPEFYIDDNGVLYYTYGENQTEYKLYIDDDGYLYIDSAAPFAVAINQDGTLCWWQRVKDSELEAEAKAAQAAADAAQQTANQNAADMAGIVTRFSGDIAELQKQIDGNITSWFISGTPTADNYPANQWTTDAEKDIHLGDLCYDEDTGYCYRWQITGGAYGWTRIADTDVTKALADAAKAQDTADNKRRVFVTQPVPPYDVGDIWVQGSGGDILRCQTPKAGGQSYVAADWVLASKYTDDTAANAAMNKANANAVTIQEHSAKIALLDDQISLRVTTEIYEQTTGELRDEISSAQTAADAASTAAGKAQTSADSASAAAGSAQTTANAAANAAANAQTTADNAKSAADANAKLISAQESEIKQLSDQISLRVTETKFSETTNSLRSEISSASSAAANAQNAASNAQSTADGANAAAGKAQSTADSASNAASAAQTAAGKAQTTADNANTAAGNAQAAADKAQTSANGAASAAANAQSTANDALGKAAANTTIINRHETEIEQLSDQISLRVTTSVYEKTTSDLRSEIGSASSAAAGAQSTADSAKSDAASAQSSANAAASAASNAQSAADKAQTTANAASNAAANAQASANAASNAAANAQSAADNAQGTADSNTELLVQQQAQITLLDKQISSKVSRTELEEVQAEAASKSVIHYGDNPPAEAGPNDIFVQDGTGIKYKPYAGDGLLPEFYLDDDGYLYYSYDSGQTVYDLMVDDDGRLCIEGNPPFTILIGEDGVPVVWEKITDGELLDAIDSTRAELGNLSAETDERINTAYSEMTQRMDEFEFVIAEKVGREEQRVYMRFDSGGVLELGKLGDRYVTQTSSSGFAVLQDGVPMATMERNTVSAPVIEARRQFALGGFAIRLGTNGELLIM